MDWAAVVALSSPDEAVTVTEQLAWPVGIAKKQYHDATDTQLSLNSATAAPH